MLTVIDRELLQALADGVHVKMYAASLNRSEQSLKNRLSKIRATLQVDTTTHAVAEALRRGLIH